MNWQILNELQQYSKQKHAESVFRQCLQNGRIITAMKIAIKYDINTLNESSYDDVQMATGMAIMASQHKK